MKNLKRDIFITLLFMTIGIAAVTGNLFISGSTELTANTDDFDVYFSDVEGVNNVTGVTINSSKNFKFTTTLENLKQEAEINFVVTNASQNYGAEVDISCTGDNDYLKITPRLENTIVPARSETGGNLKVKMIKSYISYDKTYAITCTINASAVERETLSTDTTYTEKTVMLIPQFQRDQLPFEDVNFEFIKYEAIKTITFEDEINVPDDAIASWDFGVAQNGNVIAYITANTEDSTFYDLYIQSNEQLYANPDMSCWFCDMWMLESINNIDLLDTSKVTNMSFMFGGSLLKTLNLESFDTSNVTDMSYMFVAASPTTLNLENFDTSNVTDMSYMFDGIQLTTLDLSNFNTSKVTDMSFMFNYSSFTNLDISSFDTSNVTNMGSMFNGIQLTTLDLSNFNTSKVTDMNCMFNFSSITSLNISSFDTSNVIDMSYMFSQSQLTTLDISNFNTSNVRTMSYIFNRVPLTYLNISGFDTSNVEDMSYMFAGTQLTTIDVSHFDTSNVTDMSYMFEETQVTSLELSNFDTSKVTRMDGMFRLTKLTNLDISNFNTSETVNMEFMFYKTTITTINLGIFDTRKVTKTYMMFSDSPNIKTTITIKNPNITSSYYYKMFTGAATIPAAKITVNYTSETSSLVDQMIATKSSGANVVKGSLVN